MLKQFVTLVITLFFVVLAFAQQNNGSINGTVVTNDNKPAATVSVYLTEVKRTLMADDDGRFTVRNIPAGNYTIEVTLVGYEPLRQTVSVQPNKATNVNLQLTLSEKQLQEITVTSTSRSKQSDYANKMPLAYLENSQSYSTVTKDLIKDQVLFTVDEAMRNVSGLQKMWDATSRAGDGGAYYDLRGFAVQASMRNGLASVVTTTNDAANIEKVEVLKGPSATLYGSALTSFGGLINRVIKKPYDHFGGEVNVSGGSYKFFRASTDINTPIDAAKKILFRFNGAYNTQGNFQKGTGTGNYVFAAPSLLIKPTDKLSISLDAELTRGKGVPKQFVFLYFTAADLGFNNAAQTGLDYKQSYAGNITMKSRSSNYYANGTYKISDRFTSSTNVSYSRSYSDGHNQYFFQIPNYFVTGDQNDIGTPSHYLARADQSTRGSRNNIFEAQQYFNGDFKIGRLRNRAVLGLDYTNISSNQQFYSQYTYIDVVPTNASGLNYPTFNNAAIEHFYDTASEADVQHYPIVGKTNVYSAFVSDVLNLSSNLDVIAALRVDHFRNHDIEYATSYNQTTLSPKFGLVYQPIKNQVSLFTNYQNSFTNQGSYIAYNTEAPDSLVSRFAKPEHADQWEAGIKTNLIKNKLSATFSYYHIKVTDALRTDERAPGKAQVQNGTQLSRGVELEIVSNPLKGLSVFGGLAYNDFSYENTSEDIAGFRYSGSPWLANWWLSYQFDNSLKGLHFGFGGNYASKNDIQNSPTQGEFYLPSYTVLNASAGYDFKKVGLALKVDNLTNKHYWQGYTTYNPQMLRQFVGSVSYKF